jgi:hypothetical protein
MVEERYSCAAYSVNSLYGLKQSVDFHLSPIFVNLSLLVLAIPVPIPMGRDERAILADREPVAGRLEIDPAVGLAFRATEGGTPWPIRTIRKVENVGHHAIAPGTSPAHRLYLWGNESLSGTVQSFDGNVVQLKTPAGDVLAVPVYLIAKIEHFQGNAVILREDFERDSPLGRFGGDAKRGSEQAASGEWSLSLTKPGDSLEFRLPDPIASGWVETRFFDSGASAPERQWFFELEFDSKAGVRTLQVLLGWDADSYGLATPQGPSFPVQRLARRTGWNRIGISYSAASTTVLVNEAVLTHRDVGVGLLRAVRFVVRPAPGAEGPAREVKDLAGYVDDLQMAATIALAPDRQPTRDQDDVLLVSGDQLFGHVESGTVRDITIQGDFGSWSVPWTQLHQIHFVPRSSPIKLVDGQRVRVQFATTADAKTSRNNNDVLEAVVRELTDEFIRLDHPHVGPIRVLRGQLRELEFLSAGRWLAIDSQFHHFGDQLDVRLQVPHPGGSDRSWEFSLDQVPAHSSLVLYASSMEPMVSGAEFNKRLENDEWRTYAAINGQKLDARGLNHLLPPNSRGAVRLVVPVPIGILKEGSNVLRIFQTPQKDDPKSFDDCGVFGIGLELSQP